VRKQEIGRQVINSVIVDGQQFQYRPQEGYLNFSIPILGGKTRCVSIQYENDLELASIDTSSNSLVVYVLRTASDFRDIYLSKSIIGIAVIQFYNKHEGKPAQVLGCVLVFIVVCIYVSYRWWVFVRKRHHITVEQSPEMLPGRPNRWGGGQSLQSSRAPRVAAERNKRFEPLNGKGS
jgi:hypothetical protein